MRFWERKIKEFFSVVVVDKFSGREVGLLEAPANVFNI